MSWPRSQKWWRLVNVVLDFNRNFSTPEEQERAFCCPATHCRRIKHAGIYALSRCPRAVYDIAGAVADKLPGAVLHCFTGTREEMQACVACGIYIGITGWVCDERRGLELRELLPLIPAEKLLIETDAPYLLPRDLTPKPSSRAQRQPICPIFATYWRTGVEKMPHGWLPPRMPMSKHCLGLRF
ncbi:TatD family hydrolase (plasmid) [Escherichia coli]|nr:TatD family hydrolase [Escherichia coli]